MPKAAALAAIQVPKEIFSLKNNNVRKAVSSGLMLITTSLALSAVGIFFSSLLKRTLASTVLAYAVSFFTVAGLPLLLMLLITIASPLVALLFMDSSGNLSPLTAVLVVVIGWVLVSSNPLIAALTTEAMLFDGQSPWVYQVPLPSNAPFAGLTDLPVPSPWIAYVVGYLLLSLVLIWASVRLVRQPEV